MKLNQLLKPWAIENFPDCEVLGLSNNSLHISPGDAFLAYPGAKSDGRNFIGDALARGAVAVLYEPASLPDNCLPNDSCCVAIPDLANQLAPLANIFYQSPSQQLLITGVTGTNGKTTTAYLLAQAYDILGQNARYIGTLGQGKVSDLKPLANTTPDALNLQHLLANYVQEDVQQICMEVSSHALSLNRVQAVQFDQAIYTNLSHEHLDFHHSMEAYAAAKASLFAYPDLKFAFFNQDDSYVEMMKQQVVRTCQRITYGLYSECDVRARSRQLDGLGSAFEIDSIWGSFPARIRLVGQFNIYNSLVVFATLMANGYDANQVLGVLERLTAVPGRMEVVHDEPSIVVDFAHSPDALKNVLQALGKLKRGRLIAVFGCGGDRDKEKRPIMGKIASDLADVLIVTSDNPRTEDPKAIIDEIGLGIPSTMHAKTYKYPDRKEAIQKALQIAEKGDVIVIAGKGHEPYQEINNVRMPFSDQAVVRELLNLVPHQH